MNILTKMPRIALALVFSASLLSTTGYSQHGENTDTLERGSDLTKHGSKFVYNVGVIHPSGSDAFCSAKVLFENHATVYSLSQGIGSNKRDYRDLVGHFTAYSRFQQAGRMGYHRSPDRHISCQCKSPYLC